MSTRCCRYPFECLMRHNDILNKYPVDAVNNGPIMEMPDYSGNVKENIPKLEYLGSWDQSSSTLPTQDVYKISGQGISGIFKPIANETIKYFASDDENDGAYAKFNENDKNPFNTSNEKFGFNFSDGMVFKMVGEAPMNLIDKFDNSLLAKYCPDVKPKVFHNFDENAESGVVGRTYGTRIEPIFDNDAQTKGKLKGFVITDLEGKSYYYTLPLYSWGTVSYTTKDGNSIPENGSFLLKNNGNYSYKYDPSPNAITWLLTAVTGPDYIKMSYSNRWDTWEERIRPHQGDWGYWVSFRYEYGREITTEKGLPEFKGDPTNIEDGLQPLPYKASYLWREPFTGYYHNQCSTNPDAKMYNASTGFKEITYLKSIETGSEIAYFRTSPRNDGVGGFYGDYPKAQEYQIPQSDMSGQISDNFSNKFSKQYAEVIPRNCANKDGCFKVKIPKGKLNSEKIIGSKLCKITFSGNRTIVYPGWPKKQRNTTKDELIVIYDTYGWKENGDPLGSDIDQMRQMGNDVFSRYFVQQGNDWKFTLETRTIPTDVSGNGELSTPYAKCVYIGSEGDYDVLYIISYKIVKNGMTIQTALRFSPSMFFYKVLAGYLDDVNDIKPVSGVCYNITAELFPNNILTRYQKKLDEIAWYSKADFPYIRPESDPGEEGAKTYYKWEESKYPYPESYRKVKFRYNYELAKGTPNSYEQLTKKIGKGGRLTLKEVRMEAGPEQNSVSMPPYLFTYQKNEQKYDGYDYADKWGFKLSKEEIQNNGVYTNPNVGIYWNLSEILLPSCAKLNIEYERDKIYGNEGALHRIRELDDKGDCLCDKGYDWKNQKLIKDDGYESNGRVMPKSGDWGFEGLIVDWSSNGFPIIRSNIKPEVGMYFFSYLDYGIPTLSNHSYPEHYKEVFFPIRVDEVNENADGNYNIVSDWRYLPHLLFAEKSEKSIIETGKSKLHFLVPRDLYCDGIRVKSIVSQSIAGNNYSIYKYPENGGVLEILPERALPWQLLTNAYEFKERKDGFGTIQSTYGIWRSVMNNELFSDVNLNYNTGNTSVIYPWVEVVQSADVDNNKNGKVRYEFYTTKDKVTIKDGNTSVDVPIIQKNHTFFTSSEQKETRFESEMYRYFNIVDRSAIVGQVKKIEYFNNNNKLVKKSEPQYSFGDYLENIQSPDLLNSLSGKEYPLGVIRERSLKLGKKSDSEPYAITGITDVIYAVPFVTGQTEIAYGVVNDKRYGFFNSSTGDALVTEEVNRSTGKPKLTISLPYYNLANSETQQKLSQKNILKLPGMTLINALHLNDYTKLTQLLNVGYTNQENLDPICKSETKIWCMQSVTSDNTNLPSNQFRFYQHKEYSWKGRGVNSGFEFTEQSIQSGNQWRLNSTVETTDAYLRHLCSVNALNIPTVTVYYPYTNAVMAIMQNVRFEQAAVFTCDYDDYLNVNDLGTENEQTEDGWFDKTNGWYKEISSGGSMKLVSSPVHFGKKSLFVKNTWGPRKKIYPKGNSDYIFSAWVYSNSAQPIYLQTYKKAGTGVITGTPIVPKSFTTELGKWRKIEAKIKSENLNDLPENGYLEITIGNQENVDFYVDDIRFYPDNSLVNSFYYLHDVTKPITIVDENNKAMYFKYDQFGRLTEKGHLKE